MEAKKMKNNFKYTTTESKNRVQNIINVAEEVIAKTILTLSEGGIEATLEKAWEALQTRGGFIRQERLEEAEEYCEKLPEYMRSKVLKEAEKSVDEGLISKLKALSDRLPQEISLADLEEKDGRYYLKEEKKKALRKEAEVRLSDQESEELEKILSFLQEFERIDKTYNFRRLQNIWKALKSKEAIAEEVRRVEAIEKMRKKIFDGQKAV